MKFVRCLSLILLASVSISTVCAPMCIESYAAVTEVGASLSVDRSLIDDIGLPNREGFDAALQDPIKLAYNDLKINQLSLAFRCNPDDVAEIVVPSARAVSAVITGWDITLSGMQACSENQVETLRIVMKDGTEYSVEIVYDGVNTDHNIVGGSYDATWDGASAELVWEMPYTSVSQLGRIPYLTYDTTLFVDGVETPYLNLSLSDTSTSQLRISADILKDVGTGLHRFQVINSCGESIFLNVTIPDIESFNPKVVLRTSIIENVTQNAYCVVYYGGGDLRANKVVQIETGGVVYTEDEIANSKNRIDFSAIKLWDLPAGSNDISYTFDNGYVFNGKVDVTKDFDIFPQVAYFVKSVSEDLKFSVGSFVSIVNNASGSPLTAWTDFSTSRGSFTMSKSYLSKLAVGEYSFSVDFYQDIFNGKTFKIIVVDDVSELPSDREPSVDNALKEIKVPGGEGAWDVDFGEGSKKASSIDKVTLDGKDVEYKVESDILHISGDSLIDSKPGRYPVVVEFNTGVVGNAEAELVKVPNIANKDFEYVKGSDVDVQVPVDFGSSNGVTDMLVDGTVIPDISYEVSDSGVKFPSDYLEKLDNKKHTVDIIFDDKYSTRIDDIVISVIESSELPSVVDKETTLDKSKIQVTWGAGAEKATNVISVLLEGVDVLKEVVGDFIVLDTDKLSDTDSGRHDLVITFNNASNTECVAVLVIDDEEVNTPYIVDVSQTKDKVSIEVDLGDATGIDKVLVDGDEINATLVGTVVEIDVDAIDKVGAPVMITVVFNDKDKTRDTCTVTIGSKPELPKQNLVFDKRNPGDVEVKVKLAGVDVSSVTVDDTVVPDDLWSVIGDKLIISQDVFKDKDVGTYEVELEVPSGKLTGVTVIVVDRYVRPSTDKAIYDFYKGESSDVRVVVKLGDAAGVDSVSIDSSEAEWELVDDTVVLFEDYCNTLDEGSYIVKIVFDDVDKTITKNTTLRVFESMDEAERPRLVSDSVKFTEQDMEWLFVPGSDEYEVDGIDIVLVGNVAYLPDGSKYTYSSSLVKDLEKVEDYDGPVATPSEATPAELTDRQVKIYRAINTDNPVFIAMRNVLFIDGGWFDSLGLEEGKTHLCGAVFHNSEHTVDKNKVRVIIDVEEKLEEPSSPDDKPGTEGKPNKPGNTETEDKPGDDGVDNKPDVSDKPNVRPSRPSSGGSSHSSGGSRKPSPKNPDGSYDTSYRPGIPDNGGTWSKDSDGDWIYTLPDGRVPLSQWISDGKGYYWIDENGKLLFDWFLDGNGDWYMLDKREATLGRRLYGWYHEEMDGKWYFFDMQDGHMLTGWQHIDGKWYYFTVVNGGQTYFGNNEVGWHFDPVNNTKPYGSMYSNEVTPDGRFVNESGERQ